LPFLSLPSYSKTTSLMLFTADAVAMASPENVSRLSGYRQECAVMHPKTIHW